MIRKIAREVQDGSQVRCSFLIGATPFPIEANLSKKGYTGRISVGAKALRFTIPLLKTESALEDWCLTARDVVLKFYKKGQLSRYLGMQYQDGDILTVYGTRFQLKIEEVSGLKIKATMTPERVLVLRIGQDASLLERQRHIRRILMRTFAKVFLPQLTRRVLEINELTVGKPLKEVRIRPTDSTWGTCSSLGVVTLSTRLLLAPKDVIDYVIIHELAHRVEMNHSSRFWNIVKQHCPDFEQHERWLKKNSNDCTF